MLALFLVCLVALTAAPATARGGCTVTVVQYGLTASSVQMGNYFTLNGEGFRTWSPAWVCLTGQLCNKTEVASDTTFSVTQELTNPGTYRIEVYQWHNRSGQSSDLVYSGSLTVN